MTVDAMHTRKPSDLHFARYVDVSAAVAIVGFAEACGSISSLTSPAIQCQLTVLGSSWLLQSSTGTAPRIKLGSRALSPVGPNLAVWMHASAEDETENGAVHNVRELIDHSPTVVKSDITLKFTHVHRNLVRVSAWSFRASGRKLTYILATLPTREWSSYLLSSTSQLGRQSRNWSRRRCRRRARTWSLAERSPLSPVRKPISASTTKKNDGVLVHLSCAHSSIDRRICQA
jgi:hypothetical protein